MLITDDDYSLVYYKEMNQIVIGLPQTMRTLNRTTIKVSNRKVDLTPSEEAYILNTVRVVFGEMGETVDAVPVVRCGDCKHRIPNPHGYTCKRLFKEVDLDHYCSWGERREDEVR